MESEAWDEESMVREYWMDREEYWVGVCEQDRSGKLRFSHRCVNGERFLIPGWGELDMFVFFDEQHQGWAAAFGENGVVLGACDNRVFGSPAKKCDYFPTKEQAIAYVGDTLAERKVDRSSLVKLIRKGIEMVGLSPRYRWEEMEDAS